MQVIENSDNKLVNHDFLATCNTVKQDHENYDKWMNAEFLRL
jgi:hypothetical protein